MAFPTHLAQQEIKTKKILEDLQQQLQKSKPTINSITSNNSMPTFSVPPTAQQAVQDTNSVNSPARVALRQAQETSFGFFVPQDSSFGNLFLPVLPRFENGSLPATPPTTKS